VLVIGGPSGVCLLFWKGNWNEMTHMLVLFWYTYTLCAAGDPFEDAENDGSSDADILFFKPGEGCLPHLQVRLLTKNSFCLTCKVL